MPNPDFTFKERVTAFWVWYESVAERFLKTINEHRCSDLAPEVGAKMDEFLPKFSWVFGSGEGEAQHSFTMTGEGVFDRQLLSQRWLEHAPVLPGWTFYAARQPSTPPKATICIDELEFTAQAFWLTPVLNERTKVFDVTVWHPNFSGIEKGKRWMVLFLFLDEALGEIATQNWIGRIEIGDRALAGAIPLTELPELVAATEARTGWKKYEPGGIWTGYRLKEDADRARPRGDLIAGTTCNIGLIREFLENGAEFEDPVAGFGADYVYVAIEAGFFPKGGEVAARGVIEDALTNKLDEAKSGQVIGGGMGTRYAYIDLLILDGVRSLQTIVETLRTQRVPSGSSIEFFAGEKRGHRIVI